MKKSEYILVGDLKAVRATKEVFRTTYLFDDPRRMKIFQLLIEIEEELNDKLPELEE